MKKGWIMISMIVIVMVMSACGSKKEHMDASSESSTKKTTSETEEEMTSNKKTIGKVMVNGNVYVENKDGIAANILPAGWALLGTVIKDEALPLDGDLYGIDCGKNAQVYYNEQEPANIYIGSGEEEEIRYKKFSVENLNWQYIAWKGSLFVRVSDLLESSRADSLTEEQKNTAVVQLPLKAECIGNAIGRSNGTMYPTQDLEMNIPDYDGMYVCRDKENDNYLYVETFFHSVKRYIIFMKIEKPAVP